MSTARHRSLHFATLDALFQDDDYDDDDEYLQRNVFDLLREEEYDPGNLVDFAEQSDNRNTFSYLDDARLPRSRSEMRPFYDFLGYAAAKAVSRGHLDTVRLLLDRKANVLFVDENGRSLLHLAARARNEAMLKLLLQAVDTAAPNSAAHIAGLPGMSFGGNLRFHISAEQKMEWLDQRDNQGESECLDFVLNCQENLLLSVNIICVVDYSCTIINVGLFVYA